MKGAGRLPAVVETHVDPVRDAPALRLAPATPSRRPLLVVADLHLGLEASASRPRGPPEASADGMAEALVGLAHREGARGVWVAGDVKHPIAGTPPFLRSVLFDFFATLLRERLTVDVVLGNHDPGLPRHLPREVRVHPSAGAVVAGVGIAHGHRWPSARVLARERLVIGHLHPGYRFAPTAEHPDGKHRCWLRIERPPLPPRRRGDRAPRVAAREIVVLPPFNPIAGVESLNRERPSRGRSFLFRRLVAGGIARAYLLDGTDLGVLPTPLPASGSAPRAPTAR
ncbi:MAG TPA: hypothetical protein VMG36_04115 [Thermoplasmata archaeon]|nr:hypothetical protein [Thermoplasmata archaeon]